MTREELQDLQYALPYHYIPEGYSWRDKREYEAYLSEVKDLIGLLSPRTLLDVGCGDGRLLHDLGFGLGVDLSARAIRWAIAMGVNAQVKDAREVKGKFEMVTAIEVLEHIPDWETRRFTKLLASKSERWVLICVPSTKLKVSAKHYRHYDEELLLSHIDKAFKVKLMERIVEDRHILVLGEV